jgi:ABC-type branched-subunit amino acid transport system substrate-binding protein
MRVRNVFLVLLVLAGSACTRAEAGTLLIVVDAPLQRSASIAKQIVNGARLAVEEINKAGGVRVADKTFRFSLEVVDSESSPTKTSANVRDAISRKAVAVIDEGTGVDAAWQVARDAGLPICITYQGGAELIDPDGRPNVFRIAPTYHGMAFRLAEYSIPKGHRFAIMTDDSTDGVGGESQLGKAFASSARAVATRIRLPAETTDAGVQVLQARRSGATALMVWTRPALLARVLRAARSGGWNVPVYASIHAEDPVVRQQMADHPEWLDGVTFAMSRMTSEKGPEPFTKFRTAYERRFGTEDVGVRSGGKEVVQVPDWGMYPYDFVHVLAAAIERSRATTPSKELVDGLEQAEVQGANGDERAFNEKSHEGVVDDDVFFATFKDMTWVPVRDDPLSATLPALPQTR